MSFLVCARDKSTSRISLWRLDGVTARVVNDYEIIGCGESLYKHEAKKLFRGAVNASQAAMIGLHLLSLGRATTYYIDDPFQILTVHKDGILIESPHRILALEQKVREVDETYDNLLRSAYDSAASPGGLDRALTMFEDQVRALRKQAQSVFDSSLIHGVQAVESERRDLALDVGKKAEEQSKAAQLNRALYQAGFYGSVGSPDAIEMRRKIASAIYRANEQLIDVIDLAAVLPKTAATRNVHELAKASLSIAKATSDVIDTVGTAYREKSITLEQKDRLATLLQRATNGGKRSIHILDAFRNQGISDVPKSQSGELSKAFSDEILAPVLQIYSEVSNLPDEFAGEIKVALRNVRASFLLLGDL